MSLKTTLFAGALALVPALASAHMVIEDPYARASTPNAISGAAFMSIFNHSDQDDRVIAATSDISERVELHTHIQDAQGVMRMVEVEDGFAVAAGETIRLERGGMHVMFLGLRQPLLQGDEVEVTLQFEHADPVTVMIPVDLERQPGHGAHGNHGAHDHGSHGTDG